MRGQKREGRELYSCLLLLTKSLWEQQSTFQCTASLMGASPHHSQPTGPFSVSSILPIHSPLIHFAFCLLPLELYIRRQMQPCPCSLFVQEIRSERGKTVLVRFDPFSTFRDHHSLVYLPFSQVSIDTPRVFSLQNIFNPLACFKTLHYRLRGSVGFRKM